MLGRPRHSPHLYICAPVLFRPFHLCTCRWQLGGFFGVLESVESVAGLLGPTLGGLLATAHEHAALGAVVSCYAFVFALVAIFYNAHVAAAMLV